MSKNLILIALLMQGCTVFSAQDELYPWVNRPLKIEEVQVVYHKENIFSIMKLVGWDEGSIDPITSILGFPVLGAAILECADDAQFDGKYCKCDVYLAMDYEWLREHELQHCMGYKD